MKMGLPIKEKKCKGTGQALGADACGEMRLNRTYGLCHIGGCYRKWLLNTPEGKAKVTRATLNVTAPRKSLEKATKEHKQKNGIATALTTTKQVVHEMVRLRDEGKPCISCGCQWNNTFQAGHLYASGNFFSIRFDFDNISGQCCQCNLMKNGNESNYHLRLPKRIGAERYGYLVIRAENDKKEPKNWTKDELSNIRKEARKIIKKINGSM